MVVGLGTGWSLGSTWSISLSWFSWLDGSMPYSICKRTCTELHPPSLVLLLPWICLPSSISMGSSFMRFKYWDRIKMVFCKSSWSTMLYVYTLPLLWYIRFSSQFRFEQFKTTFCSGFNVYHGPHVVSHAWIANSDLNNLYISKSFPIAVSTITV